ncbi:RNA polymerase II-associated protein 3 [Dipsacomyces acuminosporus]|nr:RNA polymerase II-associated protein 3 [Dipsacomyces acuminosporus]
MAAVGKKKAEELKAQGNSAFTRGDYASAVAQYSKAIDADRTNSVYFTNRAMALIKLERYGEAAEDCTQALRLSPNSVKALWRRGTAHFHLNKYREARDDFESGLAVEPSNKTLSAELENVNKKLSEIGTRRPVKAQPDPLRSTPPSHMAEPANSQDFERSWREYRHSPEALYKYLKLVPIADLPSLFRASLESDHISDIVGALMLARDEDGDGELIFGVLSTLPKVSRFDLAALFLGNGDKKKISELLQWLKDTKAFDISSLQREYT